MNTSKLSLSGLDRYRDLGPLAIRLFVGIVLVWGTQDNVFSQERMVEFASFLEHNGFPLPLMSAYVSAYAQFLCGIMIVLGVFVRPAALLMIGNFTVALIMVHWGLPFFENIAPMSMWVGSFFLLVTGPGKWGFGHFRTEPAEG